MLPRIHRVTTLDLRVTSWDWPFARRRVAARSIGAFRRGATAPSRKLWNGRVLLARNARLTGDRLPRRVFRDRLCELPRLARLGLSGQGRLQRLWHGRAARLRRRLRARRDGPGTPRMQVASIFPSGTPDLDDIRDGTVDIAGSVAREVEEETGLTSARTIAPPPDWCCVDTGVSLAMIRMLARRSAGRCACARRSRPILRGRSAPELSAIHLVRKRSDLTDAMPRFVTAYLEAQLPA